MSQAGTKSSPANTSTRMSLKMNTKEFYRTFGGEEEIPKNQSRVRIARAETLDSPVRARDSRVSRLKKFFDTAGRTRSPVLERSKSCSKIVASPKRESPIRFGKRKRLITITVSSPRKESPKSSTRFSGASKTSKNLIKSAIMNRQSVGLQPMNSPVKPVQEIRRLFSPSGKQE